jgi:hypothetical protein
VPDFVTTFRLHRGQVYKLIICIATINTEVVRSTAPAIHRHRTRPVASVNDGIARANSGHNTRLQLKKLVCIASIQRQFAHGTIAYYGSQLSTRGLNQRRLRSHVDDFLRGAHLHRHVERDHLVDIQIHATADVFLEPGHVELKPICSHRHLDKDVVAVVVRLNVPTDVGGFVHQSDFNVGQDGAARVGDSPDDSPGCTLGREEGWHRQTDGNHSKANYEPADST